ncbi:unnamed protein product [Spirodela intermedia]|uniref:Pectinesterase n=1 Tax=Spirodela intermedia TaxID=51605 RepID=A0A7I8ILK7_SPIIN|nr:unnamed protein product [Spirodela intermedia]CAA6658712.1 unnamed protein product [Spirodela intermedia]
MVRVVFTTFRMHWLCNAGMAPQPMLILLLFSSLCSSATAGDTAAAHSSAFVSTLRTALDEISAVQSLLSTLPGLLLGGHSRLSYAVQDCTELLSLSADELQFTLSASTSTASSSTAARRRSDLQSWLSAAVGNQITCAEGIEGTNQFVGNLVAGGLATVTSLVHQLLSQIPATAVAADGEVNGRRNRKLLVENGKFPAWMAAAERRLLQAPPSSLQPDAVVAADGTGDYSTVAEAVEAAPEKSERRFIIYVKTGLYYENVEINRNKWNIVLVGDGIGATIISGTRNFVDGWTTFRTATLAVAGEGFLARDIAVENAAGPENAQAVALRVNADLSAFYLCSFSGYQDTLYVHSFRQFYRECAISGTVDFIFGNAAVVFQGCAIQPRRPLPGQFNAITAQGRDDPNENTGISIQNCTVVAARDFAGSATRTYLGRPWREYSRTVFMETYMDSVVDPAGWREWNATRKGLETVYYGEYRNRGEGARTEKRVDWAGTT